ncbi:MAG: hypothetical protein V8R63_06290 [Thomasclavelia ramosa]
MECSIYLPIPGLDGCQVIFAVVERVIGRELPLKVKYGLQIAGLALVFWSNDLCNL